MWESIWPGTAPARAVQLLVQVSGQEGGRLEKTASACRGKKMCCEPGERTREKNGQFFNIYWLNPTLSLHGAQLSAINVKSQHRSTAEPCREKCSCTASTNPVVNVRVKAQSSGLSQALPGLWAWSLPLCYGRRSSGEQLQDSSLVAGLTGYLSHTHTYTHTNKMMMTAKHKMGSAAVRIFLAHARKMGSGQENWEEEGKSLVKESKADRNTKNRRSFKAWECGRKWKRCGERGGEKREKSQRKAGELLMPQDHRHDGCVLIVLGL